MFIKYPKIDNLKTVIKERKKFNPLSVSDEISIKGTTKIHGTNAGVTVDLSGNCYFQSRNRQITVEDDNFGFASFASANQFYFKEMANNVDFQGFDKITFFGEWCGGNIQKNIGISGIDKVFVIFSAMLSNTDEDKHFIDIDFVESLEDIGVYNIEFFGVFKTSLVMNSKESVEKIEKLTLDLEKNCPVAGYLNPTGNMVGEGIVWVSNDGSFRFKQKGKEHSIKGSSPKIKLTESFNKEKQKELNLFLESAVCQDRLKQGVDYLLEMGLDCSVKNTGNYIKWINQDVLQELRIEIEDLKTKHGIEWKYLNRIVTNVSKEYFQSVNID